jgi:hypothetical protein
MGIIGNSYNTYNTYKKQKTRESFSGFYFILTRKGSFLLYNHYPICEIYGEDTIRRAYTLPREA